MSDLIGDPSQAWTAAYWAYTESGQAMSQISQDLSPSVPTVQLESRLLQQDLLPFPLCQYNTQDYSQLLCTNSQQSQWNLTSWSRSDQNKLPSVQRGQPSLAHNAHGDAAYVAPQLSMTDATSSYFSPEQQSQWTLAQSPHTFATSSSSLACNLTVSEVPRSVPPSPVTLTDYGFRNLDNSWSCVWPGCTSRTRFTRACDLHKHYKRHSKTLFCRYYGCPQSMQAGFSSKKDRARHEAKHNPMVMCEWESCGRLFSRVDNMVGWRFFYRTAPIYREAFLLTLLVRSERSRTKGTQTAHSYSIGSAHYARTLSVNLVH